MLLFDFILNTWIHLSEMVLQDVRCAWTIPYKTMQATIIAALVRMILLMNLCIVSTFQKRSVCHIVVKMSTNLFAGQLYEFMYLVCHALSVGAHSSSSGPFFL